MNFFRNIIGFFSCLIRENCEYSIKKILIYVFSLLVIYMVILTDKDYYDILIFVGALLGIRGYERVKLWGNSAADPSVPSNPSNDQGMTDDTLLGGVKKKTDNKKLLTD
jgi:hypothetical protein